MLDLKKADKQNADFDDSGGPNISGWGCGGWDKWGQGLVCIWGGGGEISRLRSKKFPSCPPPPPLFDDNAP